MNKNNLERARLLEREILPGRDDRADTYDVDGLGDLDRLLFLEGLENRFGDESTGLGVLTGLGCLVGLITR